jgi:hypothetical protein
MAYLSEDIDDVSSRLSEEMLSKCTKIRFSFIQNTKIAKKILVDKNINIVEIQREAVSLAKKLTPQVIRLKNPSIDSKKIFKFLLNDINIASNNMVNRAGINQNDKVAKILALSLFGSTSFIYLIKYTEKMTSLPVNTASLLFGPIMEEVGIFLYNRDEIKLKNTNVFKYSRPVTRWFINSMYQGKLIAPMSVISMPLITIFRSYDKLFKNRKIQKFIKFNDEVALKRIIIIFMCFLLGIYIDDILPFIMKSIKLLDSLHED